MELRPFFNFLKKSDGLPSTFFSKFSLVVLILIAFIFGLELIAAIIRLPLDSDIFYEIG
jgi:hypothetical protein